MLKTKLVKLLIFLLIVSLLAIPFASISCDPYTVVWLLITGTCSILVNIDGNFAGELTPWITGICGIILKTTQGHHTIDFFMDVPTAGISETTTTKGTERVTTSIEGIMVSGAKWTACLEVPEESVQALRGAGILKADETGFDVSMEVFSSEPTPQEVAVSIDAPDETPPDSDFTATVDIGDVAGLNAAQYDVSFDNTVLRLDAITSGQIDGTPIPVAFEEISRGIWMVVQIMGLDTVSGSGSLAVLHFHVIGSAGESSAIDLSNGLLSGFEGEIPATWTGDSLNVSAYLLGDVNQDGEVNVLDITKIVRIILGLD